jgi:hypothetical protein
MSDGNIWATRELMINIIKQYNIIIRITSAFVDAHTYHNYHLYPVWSRSDGPNMREFCKGILEIEIIKER